MIQDAKMPEVDAAVENWLFKKSCVPILTIVGSYLMFALWIGPKLMASRKPFMLNRLMVVYNAFQVIFSAWICYFCYMENNIIEHIMAPKCLLKDFKRNLSPDLPYGAWYYFFSKIIDLFDTLFFVLRKKDNQITFLHVYHHSATALFSWMYFKYSTGEQGVFVGIINSFVHVVMYFYYMMSAMGPQYRKYLWWKKYITRIQIIQFILIISYMALILIKDCDMSKTLSLFFLIFNSIFLVQFGHFYLNTYKNRCSVPRTWTKKLN